MKKHPINILAFSIMAICLLFLGVVNNYRWLPTVYIYWILPVIIFTYFSQSFRKFQTLNKVFFIFCILIFTVSSLPDVFDPDPPALNSTSKSYISLFLIIATLISFYFLTKNDLTDTDIY